uniref:H15 domain-containing protein n=1 Tax=Callorhinchus milii TaxID=7868 RepID=A0A4W3GVV0_CALMI
MRNQEAEKRVRLQVSVAPPTAAAAASPKTSKKQVDPLLESSFKLIEEIHQIASSAEQCNGMSAVAIKKALDAKGYKTVTHKFQVRSSLKGLTEKSFLNQTKGISLERRRNLQQTRRQHYITQHKT